MNISNKATPDTRVTDQKRHIFLRVVLVTAPLFYIKYISIPNEILIIKLKIKKKKKKKKKKKIKKKKKKK